MPMAYVVVRPGDLVDVPPYVSQPFVFFSLWLNLDKGGLPSPTSVRSHQAETLACRVAP